MRLAFAMLLMSGPLVAAEPLRFKFEAGQSLTYAAKQVTTVVETTLEEGTNRPVTAAVITKLDLTRKWDVKAIEANGVATLELSIVAMRQQVTRPGPADKDGKPTIDSEVLDSATPEGREQMAAFLGKPIATVKVDSRGQVMEASGAPAERLRIELPFRLMLPDVEASKWERSFALKVATGEKYEFTQTLAIKSEAAGTTTIQIGTAPTAMPTDPGEWPPLVPVMWEGEAYFREESGRYLGSKLTAKREVVNHQGEGTRFLYESTYVEEAIAK